MKLFNINNTDAFFKVIDQCKGKVELVSSEGDCINLKSKLSQYISIAKLFDDGYIKKLELKVYDKDDEIRLMHFMYQANN